MRIIGKHESLRCLEIKNLTLFNYLFIGTSIKYSIEMNPLIYDESGRMNRRYLCTVYTAHCI